MCVDINSEIDKIARKILIIILMLRFLVKAKRENNLR